MVRPAGAGDPSGVEVDEVELAIPIPQDVARVQVRVVEAREMGPGQETTQGPGPIEDAFEAPVTFGVPQARFEGLRPGDLGHGHGVVPAAQGPESAEGRHRDSALGEEFEGRGLPPGTAAVAEHPANPGQLEALLDEGFTPWTHEASKAAALGRLLEVESCHGSRPVSPTWGRAANPAIAWAQPSGHTPRVLLQRYLLRQVLMGFLIAAGGMAFMAIPGIAVNAVHKLDGGSIALVLGYLPLVVTELVPYLVPVGFLLAIVASYGRLAADNEWTAISMAGVRPWRMLTPTLMLGSILALGTFWILSEVSPNLRKEKRSYLQSAAVESFKNLAPGRTSIRIADFYLGAAHRAEDGSFLDARIHVPFSEEDDEEGGEPQTLFAKRVSFAFRDNLMFVNLVEPETMFVGRDTVERSENGVTDLIVDLDRIFGVKKNDWTKPKYLSTREIWRALREGEVPEEKQRVFRYEAQRRMALSASLILFVLLGAPTGLLLRRGTQLGAMTAAVVYALLYYLVAINIGKQVANGTDLPVALAAWAGNGVGFAVACVLLRKALRQ